MTQKMWLEIVTREKILSTYCRVYLDILDFLQNIFFERGVYLVTGGVWKNVELFVRIMGYGGADGTTL